MDSPSAPSADGASEAEDAFGHHYLLVVSGVSMWVSGGEVVGDLPRCQPKVTVLGWFQETLGKGASRCGNHFLGNLLEELKGREYAGFGKGRVGGVVRGVDGSTSCDEEAEQL